MLIVKERLPVIKVGDHVWFTDPNEFWQKFDERHDGEPSRIGGIVERVDPDPKHCGYDWVSFRLPPTDKYHVSASDELWVIS